MGGGVKVDHWKGKMKDVNRKLVAKWMPVKPQDASEVIQEVHQIPTDQPVIDPGQREGKQLVEEIADDTMIEEVAMQGN
ncbi:hypothetical protein KY285_007916 [Solanum tuberosum]|nr:hypothetical protein KY285_007916 [Solanum tuberosum]